MRVVIQRVKEASVTVEGVVTGRIGKGFLVLFAVHKDDVPESTTWLAQKICNLRIFTDPQGKMNLALKDVGGGVLVVSQFTLYGNCMNGRRPDFIQSASGDTAEAIYDKFVDEIGKEMGSVQTGVFAAKMEVALVNDGPVTFIIEYPEKN